MENEQFYEPSKSMPKNLNECIAPYPTTENLYRWANRLKALGDVLCSILIILGIFSISSIANAIGEVNKAAAFITFLTTIISWALYVLIAYCGSRISALLFEALAATVQCRVINTKVALMKANQKANNPSPDTSETLST